LYEFRADHGELLDCGENLDDFFYSFGKTQPDRAIISHKYSAVMRLIERLNIDFDIHKILFMGLILAT
jgi:hypothetical protein